MPFKNVRQVMDEWKAGALHSGSATGPVVKNQKQAVAIALSEKRKAGGTVPPTPVAPTRREGVPGLMATRNNLKNMRQDTLPKPRRKL